ncbi:MAG TPA: hypothetical protein VN461_16475 [Vicinamibacteria bacterium]|jgi:hypothetical protein|nr:hypothetical protein [Vicinamibacteria bacterium]
MSKEHKPHEAESDPAAPAKKPSSFQWSTIIAAVIALPLAVVAFNSGREWRALSSKATALENEIATLQSRNAVLEKAYDILQNHKFQICNKSADTLTIPWITAVFHDGKQLAIFDSSRCPAWRPQILNKGESHIFTFSSEEEGCNWTGGVMFYSLNYIRESEEATKIYNMVGPWKGFDRDCFTVE